jgi:phosphopantetheinyl transferase
MAICQICKVLGGRSVILSEIELDENGMCPKCKHTSTCFGCTSVCVSKCQFAYDPYNIDGDCLALK